MGDGARRRRRSTFASLDLTNDRLLGGRIASVRHRLASRKPCEGVPLGPRTVEDEMYGYRTAILGEDIAGKAGAFVASAGAG